MEQGTHQELLRKTSGLYHRLVQRQMLGFEIGNIDNFTKPPPLKSKSLSTSPDTPSRISLVDAIDFRRTSSEDLDNPKYGSPKHSGSIA